MKQIDWKEVSTNIDLSNNYSVAVFNKFQLLSQEEVGINNIEHSYSNLIKATEDVALDMLPKKQKTAKYKPQHHTSVTQAREHLKKISLDYHKRPTRNRKTQLVSAKKSLDDAYLTAEADYINGKINDISHLHINKKHHAAWSTIKEISGKSSKATIQIKGGSSKTRMSIWSNHFENLLGNGPKLPRNCKLQRVKISDPLNISTSESTQEELRYVVKQLKSWA